MSKRILVIDDDQSFVRLVDRILTQEGYEVLKASDGQEGLRLLFAQRPDLVILDVVMPGMNGGETCRRIRELSDVPIIMLTGQKTAEEDVVHGLAYGADDYLVKPVRNRELLARVAAVLRRAKLPPPADTERTLSYSDDSLMVNLKDRKIMMKGERIGLTPTEFRLFALLLENSGRVLSHRQLLEKVWGWEYIDDLDHLRTYIWHLRRKIEPSPEQPRYILTEAGVGYRFEGAKPTR